MKDLSSRLNHRRDQHLYRHRRVTSSPQQPEMVVDGKHLLTFCSNDYLGLANDPEVAEAFRQATYKFGTGSGAAHLVNGHSKAHHELEGALAEFTGRPRALLFSTGYMANLGIAQALLEPSDAIFEDRLNHASLLDAGILSRARFKRYLHNDAHSLQKHLEKSEADDRLVMTDGIFSMDGDIAPLDQLAPLCQQHDAWLMVDDAHGIGVLGETGRGSVEHFGLSLDEVPILMGTLGKALGTGGAFVAGSDDLIEYLIQGARSYIYTTAMPAAVAAATLVSLRKVDDEPERRSHLKSLIARFRAGAAQLGIPLMPSDTPIQGLITGDSSSAVKLSSALLCEDILVTAIRPPTVPNNSARLRITLSAAHSDEHIDRLLSALEQCIC